MSAAPGFLTGFFLKQQRVNGLHTFLSSLVPLPHPTEAAPSKMQIKLDFIWWFPWSETFVSKVGDQKLFESFFASFK